MNPPVTLITATGERPFAFALCKKFVSRFNWGPIQWIVVDDGASLPVEDGPSILPSSTSLTLVRPKSFWKPGENTLARNILLAIPLIQNDFVFFIEDDDWYGPNYIQFQMESMLCAEDVMMVGEAPARYYHLPTRQYWQLKNHRHASLCQTGIHKSQIPLLRTICEEAHRDFIDVRLWERCTHTQVIQSTKECVGIKGLPGRGGIGVGHRPQKTSAWAQDSPEQEILRQWIGADISLYGGIGTL